MKEYKIDLQKLTIRLSKTLEKLPDVYKVSCHKNVYEVLGKNLRLNIKISETWIGYELIIKFPDGKIDALWEDTDNYPIDGEQIFIGFLWT